MVDYINLVKVEYESLQKKHKKYLVRAAILNNKMGTNLALLKEVRTFLVDVVRFLKKNRTRLNTKEKANLILIRDRWNDLLKDSGQ